MGKHKSGEQRLQYEMACNEALELAVGGATYRQIAAQQGLKSSGTAYKRVWHALGDVRVEEAERFRKVHLLRYMLVLRRLTIAIGGGGKDDKPLDLDVVDRYLKVLKQLEELFGVKVPGALTVEGDEKKPLRVIFEWGNGNGSSGASGKDSVRPGC